MLQPLAGLFRPSHGGDMYPSGPVSRKMLNTAEAAVYCGSSESTFNKLRLFGGGPVFVKFGRRVVYDLADLDRWLDDHRRTSRPASLRRAADTLATAPQHEKCPAPRLTATGQDQVITMTNLYEPLPTYNSAPLRQNKLFAATPDTFKPTYWRRGYDCLRTGNVDLRQSVVSALDPDRFAELRPDRMLPPNCLCYGKGLTDPVSMARGVGCWGNASTNLPNIFKTSAP
jgi:hypothetical protein